MIYYINKHHKRTYSLVEEKWLDDMRKTKPLSIAVMHPNWRGIRSSTENLFEACLYIGDSQEDINDIHVYTSLLIESGCKNIVFSGFARPFTQIVINLKKEAPSLNIFCLWHGSFMQSNEEYNWEQFKVVLGLAKSNIIHKWGFVKEGMDEMMAKQFGIRTALVKNYVKAIPKNASVVNDKTTKLGIWAISANWRKNPYAMLVACSAIENSKVYCYGHDGQVKDFINTFGINAFCQESPVPQKEMPSVLAQMHLNLYVTLSECTPMTPLESLSVGVPCLVGPNSHLFKTNDYLFESLVVPFPDKSIYIKKHIERCLTDREEIIRQYIQYATSYAAEAKLSVEQFILS
jgi:hypothetical protein